MQVFWFGMIYVGVSLLPAILAWRWCRQHQVKRAFSCPRGIIWLEKTAIWLLYRLPVSVRDSPWLAGRATKMASKLYPGIKKEKFAWQYAVKKMMILYAGWLMAGILVAGYGWGNQPPVLSQNAIPRADANGQSRDVQIEATIEGMETEQQMTLTIKPRKYSQTEKKALMENVKMYIDQCLPGENVDLGHVNQSLNFPDHFPGENVLIEWQPEDYNLIRQDGSLGVFSDTQFPIHTKVTAVICYENEREEYTKTIQIVAPEKTEEELLKEQVVQAVESADRDSSENLVLHLPDSVAGHTVTWHYQYQSQAGIVFVLGILGVVVCMCYLESRFKRKMVTRSEQLLREYPGFVHRMMLMLGAGMTVRRSWNQVLRDYEKKEHAVLKEEWLYREMKYTRLQMESGVPEIQAYMEFGQRIELQQYVRFSQLLIQYIKRGSRGMQELMQKEAEDAEKQRRDLAKRLGETAGTKLLMPMMLLLVIVLLIVMVPAFMTM